MATKGKANTTATYSASSIRQLKGLEAVRERCGMFLGSPTDGTALHHCIKEVVDNSVDEHLAGHCTEILVAIYEDESVCVGDNGRGIPVDIHPEEKVSALQLVMCSLHAGGKFDHNSYEQSAGLHGVGVSAVNAVSEWCVVQVHRDGHLYEQQYERGIPVGDVQVVGPSDTTGTTVVWLRDTTVFSEVLSYDQRIVASRLQELSFLNPGLSINFIDKRGKGLSRVYKYDGGIKDYLLEKVGKKNALVPILHFSDGKHVELAFTWTDSANEEVLCYANNTFNADGGTHLTGFKNGLTKVIVGYAKDHGMTKDLPEDGITGGDVREGIVGIINLRIPDIAFSSQTKDKLVTPRARALVEDVLVDRLSHFFVQSPGLARRITEKAVISARAREAARRARDQVKRKEWLDPLSLPGKLSDCQSRNPEQCEIFIVEGDSAGGSAKTARDRRFQAILPLRGKVLNTEKAGVEELLENKELGTIITALGCGIEQTATFDLRKLRYHKIIIMSDADVDGAHIRTLLLTFFYRSMPRLIYEGFIYIAQPPLYGARLSGATNDYYFTGETELEAFMETLSSENAKRLRITRYKGLGEMNAEDLWATTLDPKVRVMKQVSIADAIAAERFFTLLMGTDIDSRRSWIESNAHYANLDI